MVFHRHGLTALSAPECFRSLHHFCFIAVNIQAQWSLHPRSKLVESASVNLLHSSILLTWMNFAKVSKQKKLWRSWRFWLCARQHAVAKWSTDYALNQGRVFISSSNWQTQTCHVSHAWMTPHPRDFSAIPRPYQIFMELAHNFIFFYKLTSFRSYLFEITSLVALQWLWLSEQTSPLTWPEHISDGHEREEDSQAPPELEPINLGEHFSQFWRPFPCPLDGNFGCNVVEIDDYQKLQGTSSSSNRAWGALDRRLAMSPVLMSSSMSSSKSITRYKIPRIPEIQSWMAFGFSPQHHNNSSLCCSLIHSSSLVT